LRTAAVSHLVVVAGHRGRDYLADLAAIDPVLSNRSGADGRGPVLANLQRVWMAGDLSAAGGEAAPGAVLDALAGSVRPGDDLCVLFTSGSRGAPKGVVHTHGNAVRAVAAGLDARRVDPGERLYIPMPFFWTGGFSGGLMTVLVAGATLLTEAMPDPPRTVAFLESERVTLFRGWPDQGARLAADPAFAAADLSSLKPGSLDAVLPEALRARPGGRANLFGMTETFGPWCGIRLDEELPESKTGSCGLPFDGLDLRIVDPDSGGPVGVGEEGEIEVRGPNVMRAICGRLREEVFTSDGAYRTGDLGVVDADGHLYYRGRVDDMFKVSGATVYPSEVEAALRSIPGVVRAHVTDITSGSASEVGAAVLGDGSVDLGGIAAAARERLSAFKVPRRWVLLHTADEVPLMATGKIDKPGLQQLIRSAGPGS